MLESTFSTNPLDALLIPFVWKKFEKRDFKTGQFLTRLAEVVPAFASFQALTLEKYLQERKDRYSNPFAEIVRHLVALECKTVLFEFSYIDSDYLNEFSAFYSRCFKTYSSRCLRLHFFDVEIPENAKFDFDQYPEDAYLGFSVLRPTDRNIIGRTVIKADCCSSDSQFITCTTSFSAHLLGKEFRVKGMPFIQQDTQVGACAQAALWMMVRYLSRRYNLREFLPAEINKLAKTHLQFGREFPADKDGLTAEQILGALKGMGFSAIFYEKNELGETSKELEKAWMANEGLDLVTDERAREEADIERRNTLASLKLADIAYRYIESKLPVIFNFKDHAVVGIGHSYDCNKDASFTIERIPSFYIHNDGGGPYLELPIAKKTGNGLSFLDVKTIIAVAPPTAMLCPENAEAAVRKTIYRLPSLLKQPSPSGVPISQTLIDAGFSVSVDKLEYRTYLQSCVEFQQDIRKQMKEGKLSAEVGSKLLEVDYPRFVWVTELSSSQLLNKPQKDQRMCVGRVVVDSTAANKARCVIAIHFCDWLLVIDRQGISPEESSLVQGSTPFTHKFTT